MFDLADAALPLPALTREVFVRAWHEIASPGAFWTAEERTAIAALARDHRRGRPTMDPRLPPDAGEAVALLAATPAVTTREWVDGIVATLGEERYVELVGIVSSVVGVDTVTRLLGGTLEPFPGPGPGEPSAARASGRVDKGRAWVNMAGMAVPPNVLSLVPSTQRATNDVIEHLYMTGPQMGDHDIVMDGLHRTQIELVAGTTSHGNECFY